MADSIFVTLSAFAEYDPAPLRLLEASGIPFTVNRSGKRITGDELIAQGQHATAVVAGVESYDAATLARLPALRCISRCGAGIDAVDLAAARTRGIAVLNTPDAPTQAVAELAVAMILSLSRNLRRQSNLMGARDWRRLEAHLVSGRHLGVIGLGRIGRRVVELLTPFRPVFAAHDPHADAAWAAAHGVALVSIDELLTTSDVISLHAAGSADHPMRLGAPEFARMKPGALLINLARGTMIDDEALFAALTSGHLGGAGLDVFGEEPYCGPLCDLGNVLLTPHSATLTVETRVAMETDCVRNAIGFLQGT
jgi:D-3-phosphoglycerate dehydrogenase